MRVAAFPCRGRGRRFTASGSVGIAGGGILHRNDTGDWTKAAPDLYPHQWSWGSAFIVIGLAQLDTGRADRELVSTFEHQWATGKVPHIVFDPEVPPESYFPGPEHWAAAAPKSPDAPPTPALTSGLCQPPVHAIAALRILQLALLVGCDPRRRAGESRAAAANLAGADLERRFRGVLRALHRRAPRLGRPVLDGGRRP